MGKPENSVADQTSRKLNSARGLIGRRAFVQVSVVVVTLVLIGQAVSATASSTGGTDIARDQESMALLV